MSDIKAVVTLDKHLNNRDNNFDFLRFLAALAVIYSHSFDLIGRNSEEPLRRFSHNYISLGTLSVYIFFIISGYLITNSYHRAKSLKQYFAARILRIYPALIVVTLITVFLLGPVVKTDITIAVYFSYLQTYMYLLNSFSFKMFYDLPHVFSSNKTTVVNGPIWSLPYEISCYLMVVVLGELKKKKVIIAAIVAVILLFLYVCIGLPLWKNIVTYTLFFGAGALYYQLRKLVVLKNIFTGILIVGLILMLKLNINVHAKDLVMCIALPYVLINIAYKKGVFNKFAHYGDFSYGLYIIGWPVQQIIINNNKSVSTLNLFLLASSISIVLAYLSWHLIEERALKYKKKFI